MTEETKKTLATDADGLLSYEYIANNIEDVLDDIDYVIANMARADMNGQFLASAARYLHAIDPKKFDNQIRSLVASTIDRDREHKYIGDILHSIYGSDYEEKAPELISTDNNFRRIYKRLYPHTPI